MCSLVFTMTKPGTFTSISPPTSALLENHPRNISTVECSHAPQTAIYTSNASFLATISETLPFWSKLILTPVPQISTRMNKLQPSQNLSWRLFTHCFHVCLRNRLPQERSCLYLSSKAQTHCWHFSLKISWKYFYLFHTEQNAPAMMHLFSYSNKSCKLSLLFQSKLHAGMRMHTGYHGGTGKHLKSWQGSEYNWNGWSCRGRIPPSKPNKTLLLEAAVSWNKSCFQKVGTCIIVLQNPHSCLERIWKRVFKQIFSRAKKATSTSNKFFSLNIFKCIPFT